MQSGVSRHVSTVPNWLQAEVPNGEEGGRAAVGVPKSLQAWGTRGSTGRTLLHFTFTAPPERFSRDQVEARLLRLVLLGLSLSLSLSSLSLSLSLPLSLLAGEKAPMPEKEEERWKSLLLLVTGENGGKQEWGSGSATEMGDRRGAL